MKLSETLNSAIIALKANKLRSSLTMSGVVIGVFAVVSLISLVKGLQNYITDTFNSLGSNLIIIAPGRAGFDQDPALAFTNNKLEKKHVDIIEKDVGEYLVGVTPNIRLSKTVEYKNKQFLGFLIGTNYKVKDIVDLKIVSGRFFTKSEETSKARVAVIGPLVKKELFGVSNPLGKKIKIAGVSFEVIGVLESEGPNSDERIMIPYTSAKDALGVDQFSGITTKAKNSEDIDFVMGQIELALLSDLKSDEFTVLSQKDLLSTVGSIMGILSAALGGIAAISLLVGGIGIMNIMLVSVTERTREIGLRKALGATRSNIGTQFIIESIFISLLGGLIGLGLSIVLTLGAQQFFPAQITIWSIILALGFSILVGVVF
ncbi:ABC transporter permease, partial [bacterium]|nr:ABC transporter permease [bacterium]